ncbi:C2 calcium-dependent domain-containing protein 4A [Nannospalax galili]|uniref:C2 calcium-dependent domain-containing protein 4A n=1 Tax=Nannospalax galili TaxID=1026970 RepID=UPI0004ED6488|nr:C2 calcium-dependent domain-containing protein 4A [Nannospalax galili]
MWCLERLLRDRHGLLTGHARRSKPRSSTACANVLTPDRIPEFCIPPRLEPNLAWAALRDAGAPDSGSDGEDLTDWDPRSQAALSLPHLPRTRTTYGFCALLESPHTRRKESLFHGHPRAPSRARPPSSRPSPRPRAHTYLLLRAAGQQRAAVLGRSRRAAFGQDFTFDGLAEEQLRRLAVRVKAKSKGRGLERGRPLGQGELLLGSLLPL